MKNVLSPHDSSFSLSRRYFNFHKKIPNDNHYYYSDAEDDHNNLTLDSLSFSDYPVPNSLTPFEAPKWPGRLPKLLRILARPSRGWRTRGLGTLFGNRRGCVHFAFQEGPRRSPQLLVQLATPTSILVKEMASGLVRVALECDVGDKKRRKRLVDEEELLQREEVRVRSVEDVRGRGRAGSEGAGASEI